MELEDQRLHLAYISPTSRRHLAHISPVSPLYLACRAKSPLPQLPVSPMKVSSWSGLGLGLGLVGVGLGYR